jgi:hypothetical protein
MAKPKAAPRDAGEPIMAIFAEDVELVLVTKRRKRASSAEFFQKG